jgi:hypothetical protein
VASKLCLEWSPEQIAGWLKRTYPGSPIGAVGTGGVGSRTRVRASPRKLVAGYARKRPTISRRPLIEAVVAGPASELETHPDSVDTAVGVEANDKDTCGPVAVPKMTYAPLESDH